MCKRHGKHSSLGDNKPGSHSNNSARHTYIPRNNGTNKGSNRRTHNLSNSNTSSNNRHIMYTRWLQPHLPSSNSTNQNRGLTCSSNRSPQMDTSNIGMREREREER